MMHISKRVKKVSRLLFGLILVLAGLFLVAQWSPSWVKNLPLDFVIVSLCYGWVVLYRINARRIEEKYQTRKACLTIVEVEFSFLEHNCIFVSDEASSLARVIVCMERYHAVGGSSGYSRKIFDVALTTLGLFVPDIKDREVLLGQARREVKRKLAAPATVGAPLN